MTAPLHQAPDAEPHRHVAGAPCFPECPGWSTPAPGGRGYQAPDAEERCAAAVIRTDGDGCEYDDACDEPAVSFAYSNPDGDRVDPGEGDPYPTCAEHADPLVRAISDGATGALVNCSRLPDWMQVHALGRDIRPLGNLVAEALAPTVARLVREGAERAVGDFAEWVATHRAYNGSEHQGGQRLYDEGMNTRLAFWAADYSAEVLSDAAGADLSAERAESGNLGDGRSAGLSGLLGDLMAENKRAWIEQHGPTGALEGVREAGEG